MKRLALGLLLCGLAWGVSPQDWAERALQFEKASQWDQAEQSWKQAIAGFENNGNKQALARACFYMGRLCFDRKKVELAADWLEKSRRLFEQVKESKGKALAGLQLGLIYLELKRYPQAEEALRQALQAAVEDKDRKREHEILGHLAGYYDIAHRWPEAQDAYARLADFQRESAAPQRAETLVSLASVLQVQNQSEQALKTYQEAGTLFGAQGRQAEARDVQGRVARLLLTSERYAEAEQVYAELVKSDPSSVSARANRAYCLEKLQRIPEALQVYESLLAEPMEEKNQQAIGDQRIRLLYATGQKELALQDLARYPHFRTQARLLDELGESERAARLLEENLKTLGQPEEAAEVANQLGLLWLRKGQHERAAGVFRQALQAKEALSGEIRATLLTNLAETYLDRDDYEPAVTLLQEAIPLWRKSGESAQCMTSLNNLAAAHQARGRWDKALEYLLEAQKVGDGFHKPAPIQATVANSLGLLYIKTGHFAEGMDYYRKALSLRRLLRDRRGELVTLLNMGTAESQQNRKESAQKYFDQAQLLNREIKDLRLEATLCNNRALNQPEAVESEAWLLRALELCSEERQPYDRGVALSNLARRKAGKGDMSLARAYADQALALFKRLSAREEWFGLLDFYLVHGANPGQDPGVEMLDLLEDLLHGLPTRVARGFVGAHQASLSRVVEQAYTRSQARGLLETEERVRALGVLALTSGTAPGSSVPADLRQRLVSLQQRLSESLRQGNSQELAALKREYGLVCEQVERQNLAQGVVTKARSATLEELQKQLLGEEVLVEFIELPGNRRLAVLVDSAQIQVVELPPMPGSQGPRALSPSDRPAVLEKWGQLLIAPWISRVGPEKRRLVLVPTGNLHQIPFAALTLEGVPLVERFQVDESTSATAWLVSRQLRRQGQGTLLAALGNFTGSPGLSPLPGTLQEVAGIRKQWPEAAVLQESAMTRGALRQASAHRKLLHFATHGLLDPDNPLSGGLACSDGLVAVGDIFQWQLEAEVAVLSACNTGRFGSGQEYVALSRAFQCAGARSLVVTLWSVSDEATAQWMQEFHAQLRQGNTLSEAHRQATLRLRKQQAFPFYWAPFVVWGDGNIRV